MIGQGHTPSPFMLFATNESVFTNLVLPLLHKNISPKVLDPLPLMLNDFDILLKFSAS